MATILPFRQGEPGRKKPAGEVATARGAEIVIFPGVRVEYYDRAPAPTGKGRPRRRRRNPAKDAASA